MIEIGARGHRSDGVSMSAERVLRKVFGDDPGGFRVECFDGSSVGRADASTVIRITSPDFFRRLALGRASELAFSRAFVAGDVEIDGPIYNALSIREQASKISLSRDLVKDIANLVGIEKISDFRGQRRPPIPEEEARPTGALHSLQRDKQSISSHYDVSNEFYGLFLGPTMTYSCAVFDSHDDTLEQAQLNKYDLICRKLGLEPGMRLLDIGCGWGEMVIHAAKTYGVEAVGVTISKEQLELAEKRVAAAGLTDRIELRLQDYREIADGPFDAVSSIGMFEHVGEDRLAEYFGQIEDLLRPGGRLLNHAISWGVDIGRSHTDPNGFISRYVFPDGELLEPGKVVSAINANGFEVRHMESFREHYAKTLRIWVDALEANWDEAVRLTSPGRARVWRLYMAASAVAFEENALTLMQILATKTIDGQSDMPLRIDW